MNHHPPLTVHLTENPPCVHLNSHPVSVNTQHSHKGSSSRHDTNLAWRNLVDNTTAASLSPCITDASDTKTFYSAIQVTDIHPDSSDEDDNISITTGMAAGSTSNGASVAEDKPAKPRKSPSRSSSTSQRSPRSASSSTAGTSKKERRRTASFQAQSPASPPRSNSIQMSQQKRDELLALHRDSCRIFQDVGMAAEPLENSYDEPRLTQSTTVSPIMSPILQYQRSHSFPINDGDVSEDDLLSVRQPRRISIVHSEPDPEREPSQPPQSPHEQVPTTVIDWTSPSTRRREYEAIDRSNRCFRRIWRRMTPRCFRPSGARTPFFETGKDGKANYEGSVRRFRMDITDEKEAVSRPKPVKRTWSCF
ncbi:uncharacterized protein TRUGW13939_06212 [Talaromyces rugulosus]|uniref:Uncharacterized protein n=1 Tax=Talaromyces rugulosus TaxID=121627 RepID=A0A7H8QYC4_TALRU|nr:uncharacterized protein TRUGW13939_06212 [Talaromyces rugulosus]QKX59082.1 hypothetical protein TRUGW13939_06212 [Talaromyces rugulosus]